MKSIKITASRRKFVCTSKDKVMYNGACYQLVTQAFYKDWCNYTPVISKAEFSRLMKLGVLSEPYERKGESGIVVMVYDFVLHGMNIEEVT